MAPIRPGDRDTSGDRRGLLVCRADLPVDVLIRCDRTSPLEDRCVRSMSSPRRRRDSRRCRRSRTLPGRRPAGWTRSFSRPVRPARESCTTDGLSDRPPQSLPRPASPRPHPDPLISAVPRAKGGQAANSAAEARGEQGRPPQAIAAGRNARIEEGPEVKAALSPTPPRQQRYCRGLRPESAPNPQP